MPIPRSFVTALLLMTVPALAEAQPDPLEARIASGIELLHARKPDEGRPILEKAAAELGDAVAADAKNARAHFLLARALFYLQQDADAVAMIDKAVELSPTSAAYHAERGNMFAQTGKMSASVEALARATELDPKNADFWITLAYRYADLSAHDEAEKTFERAIALNPAEPRLLGALAGTYATTGKPERAIPLLEKAVALDPKYANGWRNLGQIHQTAGRPAESNRAFAKLLAVTPGDAPALAKLVQNYTALKDGKAADAAREKLFALSKAGKVPQPFYCREQFKFHDSPVMVFEYFELTGDRALRYSFRVLDESGRKTERTISLGSYDVTTEMARETGQIPKDARMFHLDSYEPGGHSTFGMYDKEPTYDQVRTSVVAILEGKTKPLSSTKMEPEMKDEK